jgi:hypothetical protein
MNVSKEIIVQLNELKKTYYEKNTKNIFFKKSQKMDFTNTVLSEYDLNYLIQNTCTIIPNTNRIYIDYRVFKMYANPLNYYNIIQYILNLLNNCIEKYGSVYTCVNLDSFSVSAAERYKDIIQMYCNECIKSNTNYAELTNKIYIYNTPLVMGTISQLLSKIICKEIREKVIMFSKEESDKKIEELFNAPM